MNNLFLAAGDWSNTLLQYIIYGAIIIVSIVLLILLHKHSRLPRHSELKKKLATLSDDINGINPSDKRMDFIKSVTRAMYKADNLAFIAAMLAEKERYADLNKISALIGEARAELSPYKFGKKEADDDDGLKVAAAKIAQATAILDSVIVRDAKINKSR